MMAPRVNCAGALIARGAFAARGMLRSFRCHAPSLSVVLPRFLSVVMPREGGASSNPCAAIEAEAVPCRKAGNYWIVRFRGR